MVAPRKPEFVSKEDATDVAYGLKLFLDGGPIVTWQERQSSDSGPS
jgi:hypothetical protein